MGVMEKSGRMRQREGVRVEVANLMSCCISPSDSCWEERRKKKWGMITVDLFIKQIYLPWLTQRGAPLIRCLTSSLSQQIIMLFYTLHTYQ